MSILMWLSGVVMVLVMVFVVVFVVKIVVLLGISVSSVSGWFISCVVGGSLCFVDFVFFFFFLVIVFFILLDCMMIVFLIVLVMVVVEFLLLWMESEVKVSSWGFVWSSGGVLVWFFCGGCYEL